MEPNISVPAQRQSSTRTYHLFYDLQFGFFISPNTDFLPQIPNLTDRMNSVFEGLRPRFAHDDWFYLSFVPRQVRYDLPMFECLAPLACTLEHVQTQMGRGYRLAEGLIKKWTALESISTHIQRKLLRRTSGTYLETLVPPYPSSMGFWRTWDTRSKALLSIRLARTAFTLRFAFLSWLVMKEKVKGRDTWTELASDRDEPIPLSICNSFRASWITDFRVPRIGAFVDIRGTMLPEAGRQWHEDISAMLEIGIPIWFAYGNSPTPHSQLNKLSRDICLYYRPDKYAVDILHNITSQGYSTIEARFHGSQTSTGMDSTLDMDLSEVYGYITQLRHSPTPPTHAFVRSRHHVTLAYPLTFTSGTTSVGGGFEFGPLHTVLETSPLNYRYRQRPGDTYQSFVAREARMIEAMKRSESGADQQNRTQRELFNRDQPVPSDKGPTVYVWIVEGEEQIRLRVHPKDVPELWKRTTTSKREYNSFRDEYDVDDTIAATDISADHVDTFDERTRARSASPRPRRQCSSGSRTPPTPTIRDERTTALPRFKPITVSQEQLSDVPARRETLNNDADILLDMSILQAEVFAAPSIDDIDDIVRHRYGFRIPDGEWHARSQEGREWTLNRKVAKVYRTFAYWDKNKSAERDAIPNDQLEPLADFAAIVRQGQSPPTELCDLVPPSSPLACGPAYSSLRVHCHKLVSEYSDTHQDQTPWYMIWSLNTEILETSTNCILSTDMATNILHLQRADFGTSADAILTSLLCRGMRVRLLRPVSTIANRQPQDEKVATINNRPLGIGVKPHGIELNQQDYAAYVRMRNELLRGPAGPRALLAGGIIWRLASNICPIGETSRGPDIDDDYLSSSVNAVMFDTQQYVEATLTQQDQYVIVGVYRIRQPLDKNGQATQVAAITSWWPTNEIWATSGYAPGYWSHDAEEWFQTRLQHIRMGTAKPMNSNEWRKALRHNLTDSHKFIASIEKLSVQKVSSMSQ